MHETADIADEAEKAAKIERIKADVERFRDIVLKAEEIDRGRARQGLEAGEDGDQARAGSTSSDPNATNRGASTTSCAAAPAARATPGARNSSCRWKTI